MNAKRTTTNKKSTKKQMSKVVHLSKNVKVKLPTRAAYRAKLDKKSTIKRKKMALAFRKAEQQETKILKQKAKDQAKLIRQEKKEQAKQARLALQEQRKQAHAQAKEDRRNAISAKKAAREAQVWKNRFNKCSFTFRVLGKNYKRLKAYKGFQFWFHGPLPTDPAQLGTLLHFASQYMKWYGFKVQLSVVDGYLVFGTKVKQPLGAIRKTLATAVYAFLTGTGFYPNE